MKTQQPKIKTKEKQTMNNEKFYSDAETKLRDSGNHQSPIMKKNQVIKAIKKFKEKLNNDEYKTGTD